MQKSKSQKKSQQRRRGEGRKLTVKNGKNAKICRPGRGTQTRTKEERHRHKQERKEKRRRVSQREGE